MTRHASHRPCVSPRLACGVWRPALPWTLAGRAETPRPRRWVPREPTGTEHSAEKPEDFPAPASGQLQTPPELGGGAVCQDTPREAYVHSG